MTLYFTPGTNRRLARIRSHLGGSLSHVVAHVLNVAEKEIREHPLARPWETDLPSTEPASRNTIYLHARSDQRLEDLRVIFQGLEEESGCAILQSVVVARAIALAEQRILNLTPDEIELQRLRADAAAIDVEVSHLEEDWGEEAIVKLLTCMHQAAALITRAQKAQERTGSAWIKPLPRQNSAVWSEVGELITGPLNDLMGRIAQAIKRVRLETDQHQRKPHVRDHLG